MDNKHTYTIQECKLLAQIEEHEAKLLEISRSDLACELTDEIREFRVELNRQRQELLAELNKRRSYQKYVDEPINTNYDNNQPYWPNIEQYEVGVFGHGNFDQN